MSLWSIKQSIIDTFNYEVDIDTGEKLEGAELYAKLDELNMEQDKKIENTILFIKNELADEEAIKAEKLKLNARQNTKKNNAERAKNYLQYYIKSLYTNEDGEINEEFMRKDFKFESPKCVLKFSKSSSTNILDFAKIPKEFIKEHFNTEKDVDKTSLKKYLKGIDGNKTEFAEIKVNSNLSIK